MKAVTATAAALLAAFLGAAPSAAGQGEDETGERIRASIARINPDTTVEAVAPTPVDGLYAVSLDGTVVYMTGDGRYLFQGELIDLQTRRSLTEDIRREGRAERLAALPESRMVIYEPEGTARHEVTVFTDIDCPYCRRMHAELDGYLERGIRIRYLLMPRAGKPSESYDKAVAAWCADDPRAALTRAKRGERLDRRQCDHPVDEHMALAEAFNVRGTPSLILADGTMLSGYRPPADLAEILAGLEGN